MQWCPGLSNTKKTETDKNDAENIEPKTKDAHDDDSESDCDSDSKHSVPSIETEYPFMKFFKDVPNGRYDEGEGTRDDSENQREDQRVS